ncbi:glycosyltransferase family 4 protein [Citricoccus sp. GCM10030269]|uniref:glycosyltransferase family 4 protein n=1 Tax=Citricoccus sp. GCM10030269 TaxID=3273388 RepID=UPI003623E212
MKILLACGYFDWFSGYQETGLAKSFSSIADTYVVAGDRVNPIFSDSHLADRDHPRNYSVGTSREHGVTVKRVGVTEKRSMLFSSNYREAVESVDPDLVIQVMPGQILPALATKAAPDTPHLVLYGDNSAMWSNLTDLQRKIKWHVFSQTKGRLYSWVNAPATKLFGYTPETVDRLSPFSAGTDMEVLPLAYRRDHFYFDETLRSDTRAKLGIQDHEIAVLVAGKIQPQKRIDIVAAAVSRAISTGSSVKFIVAGGTSSPDAAKVLEPVFELPQMRSSIIQTGFLSQQGLNEVFNAADVGVWPTMPAITIQQAMGTGLPVVIPDNTIVGHLLKTGTGWFIDSGSSIEDQVLDILRGLPDLSIDRPDYAKRNQWLSSDLVARELARYARLTP